MKIIVLIMKDNRIIREENFSHLTSLHEFIEENMDLNLLKKLAKDYCKAKDFHCKLPSGGKIDLNYIDVLKKCLSPTDFLIYVSDPLVNTFIETIDKKLRENGRFQYDKYRFLRNAIC